MTRPPYASNARLSHAAPLPVTQRASCIDRSHGISTKPGISAQCAHALARDGRGAHGSCFKLKCTCPCHNAVTGGVRV